MRHDILLFLFVAIMCAALFSGSSTTQEIPVSSEATVQEPLTGMNELKFVTEDYPPFNYLENGTIRGISVDMLAGVYGEVNLSLAPGRITCFPGMRPTRPRKWRTIP